MIKERDYCPYCGVLVEFDQPGEYHEVPEGEPCDGIICPHCGKKLVITYYTTVNFELSKVEDFDEEDLDVIDF